MEEERQDQPTETASAATPVAVNKPPSVTTPKVDATPAPPPMFAVSGKDCCDCSGFCNFPQGWQAGRALIVSLIALVLSLAAMGSCNFMRVDGLGWGFLWREETVPEAQATTRISECINWRGYERALFDASWKTATAFAYLTVITSIIATGVILSLSCSTISRSYARLIGGFLILSSFFQALCFLSFGSSICDDYECTLSFGAGLTVGSSIMTVLAAVTLFMLNPLSEKRKSSHGGAASADETHPHDETFIVEEPEERPSTPMDAASDAAVDSNLAAYRAEDSMEDVPLEEGEEEEEDLEVQAEKEDEEKKKNQPSPEV